MPESLAEDIIHLFPHNSYDLVFDITPLTSLPAKPEPSKPKLTISCKPTISSHPRTTNSAPSSPTMDVDTEEGNLIPRCQNLPTKDGSLVIRRAPQIREYSQSGTKIALRTSIAEEFNYLRPDMLQENQRAFEELARRQVQDEEDLNTAHMIAQEEADQAKKLPILLRANSTL